MTYDPKARAKAHEEYAQRKCDELIKETAELRTSLLLSQRDVANVIGASSHANLALIEQGKSVPRLDSMLRILSAYGRTLKIVPKDE